MSTIHSTRSTTTTAATSTSRKVKAATPVAATRANTDPPELDIRSFAGDLNLTESQRGHVRPLLSADARKQGRIQHMHWSSDAARRASLWQARDETVAQVQPVLDPKQVEKLKTLLGPAK